MYTQGVPIDIIQLRGRWRSLASHTYLWRDASPLRGLSRVIARPKGIAELLRFVPKQKILSFKNSEFRNMAFGPIEQPVPNLLRVNMRDMVDISVTDGARGGSESETVQNRLKKGPEIQPMMPENLLYLCIWRDSWGIGGARLMFRKKHRAWLIRSAQTPISTIERSKRRLGNRIPQTGNDPASDADFPEIDSDSSNKESGDEAPDPVLLGTDQVVSLKNKIDIDSSDVENGANAPEPLQPEAGQKDDAENAEITSVDSNEGNGDELPVIVYQRRS